jgi:transcriptional regulator with XRE-family HTH domain
LISFDAKFIITVMDTVLLKDVMPRLGKILKTYREKTGRNQSDIAQKAGISVSMLSQIERGNVSPSIETLILVCNVLGIETADIFRLLSCNQSVRIHHSGERLKLRNTGICYEQLMTSVQGAHQAEMFLLEVEPGFETTMSNNGHEGIEIGFVLKGEGTLIVDGSEYSIREGDSVFYKSSQKHQLRNCGKTIFKAVWSITPPHVDYLKNSVGQ